MLRFCPNCWAEVPSDSQSCPCCGRSLAAGDEDYIDKLICALRHPEPTRAALAIQVLIEMLAEPRAIEPLIGLLDTASDAYVLKCAAAALGRFGDPRAVGPLGRLALDASNPLVVRMAAVDALARIGGDHAQALLSAAVSDPSPSVRELAHRVLSSCNDAGRRQKRTARHGPPRAEGSKVE